MQQQQNKDDLAAKLEQWDSFIKEGKADLVKKQVKSLLSKIRLQREQRLGFARILRRVGEYDHAVRILFSIIRPPPKKPTIPSSEETIEYASSLLQSGCLLEGRHLLNSIKSDSIAAKNLFLAFSYFAEWDYQSALPFLESYLESTQITSYERLIGQINYLAALVATHRSEDAKTLLYHLKPALKNSSYQLLYANCCEIEAQNSIRSGEFAIANRQLEEIRELFHNLGNPYQFYWQKWTLILQGMQAKSSQAQYRINLDLRELSQRAADENFSEVSRDADYWRAQFSRNQSLMNFVYLGTPSDSYREKMRAENSWFQPDYQTLFWPVEEGQKSEKDDLSWAFEKKQLPYVLLQTLLSDFYRRWNIGGLFSKLYPSEHYNPDVAHQKVSQIILRANSLLKSKHKGLRIRRENNKVFLSTQRTFTFKNVNPEVIPLNREQMALKAFMDKLRRHSRLGVDRWLSSGEIHRGLGMARRTCQSLLQKAVEEKLLTKRGIKKSIKYKIIT